MGADHCHSHYHGVCCHYGPYPWRRPLGPATCYIEGRWIITYGQRGRTSTVEMYMGSWTDSFRLRAAGKKGDLHPIAVGCPVTPPSLSPLPGSNRHLCTSGPSQRIRLRSYHLQRLVFCGWFSPASIVTFSIALLSHPPRLLLCISSRFYLIRQGPCFSIISDSFPNTQFCALEYTVRGRPSQSLRSFIPASSYVI